MPKKDGQSNTSAKALPKRRFRFCLGDVFVIVSILLFCAILIVGTWIYTRKNKNKPPYVRITRDGQVLLEKDLREFPEPMEYRIDGDHGHMVIYISSEKVYVKESDCPDKICMHKGDLSKPGDGAVCLPNRVVVEIVAGDEDDTSGKVDVISK